MSPVFTKRICKIASCCLIGLPIFCFGGEGEDEGCKPLVELFRNLSLNEKDKEEIIARIHSIIESLNSEECLYALSKKERDEIVESGKSWYTWITKKIQNEKFKDSARDIVSKISFKRGLLWNTCSTRPIQCLEESKIKVSNILIQIIYVEDFWEKFNARAQYLVSNPDKTFIENHAEGEKTWDEIVREDVFYYGYFELSDEEQENIQRKLGLTQEGTNSETMQ